MHTHIIAPVAQTIQTPRAALPRCISSTLLPVHRSLLLRRHIAGALDTCRSIRPGRRILFSFDIVQCHACLTTVYIREGFSGSRGDARAEYVFMISPAPWFLPCDDARSCSAFVCLSGFARHGQSRRCQSASRIHVCISRHAKVASSRRQCHATARIRILLRRHAGQARVASSFCRRHLCASFFDIYT